MATDSITFMGVYAGGWTGDVPIVPNGAYSTELTHEVERLAKIEVMGRPAWARGAFRLTYLAPPDRERMW
jgi:hypothetical protein